MPASWRVVAARRLPVARSRMRCARAPSGVTDATRPSVIRRSTWSRPRLHGVPGANAVEDSSRAMGHLKFDEGLGLDLLDEAVVCAGPAFGGDDGRVHVAADVCAR